MDPLGGSNGKALYKKAIGIYSPDQDLIDALMMVDLPPGVDCEVEI